MKPGGTAARGYDAAHKAERLRWAPIVNSGRAYCAGCGGWIDPTPIIGRNGNLISPWHLAHNDTRTAWLGPMHLRCNIADANAKMKATFRRKAILRRGGIVWSRW